MARKEETPKSPAPQPPLLNRRHQTKAQRDAVIRQRVVIGTAIVGVLSVIILIIGAFYSTVFEPQEAMADISGGNIAAEKITRDQFYKRVNYERFRIYLVDRNTREQALEYLADPNSAQFFAQFFQQQQQQLQQQYASIGSNVLNQMISERVVAEDAATRGITVSDEEVDTEIRRQMADLNQAIIQEDVDATATGVVNATATAAGFTPTPEPTATATLTATATISDTGTVTDTETVTATATAIATFTPAPSPTPNVFTTEKFDPAYQEFLSTLQSRVGYNEQEYRAVVRSQLLYDKVKEAVQAEAESTVEVPDVEEQIHAAHILVATQEEAQAALDRINAGEDFATVAQELSTDTGSGAQGGDLGWFGRDTMVTEFSNAAFALTTPGQVSEPVQTQFGWHIIKLLEGPEERARDGATVEQERQTQLAQAWTDYVQNLETQYTINRYWDLGDLPSDPFLKELQEPLPTPVPAPTEPAVPTTGAVTDTGTITETAPVTGTEPTVAP